MKIGKPKSIGVLVIAALIFASSSFATPPQGHQPKYRACTVNGNCSTQDLNTDCSSQVITFCWTCSGAGSLFSCVGPATVNECQDFNPVPVCGEREVGYCAVDNCSTSAPTGVNCDGWDCQ